MSEQAEALASGGLSDLASYLDNPQQEPEEDTEDQTADSETPDEDTSEDANAEQDDSEEEDSTDEDAEDPAIERKVAVTTKAEDGTETTEEVPESELVKGYMRQSAFTKKTQALAERENQAVQFLTTKHEEIRANYLQQAEVQRAAIVQMAGIKTDDEMAQLANSDPAAWVAENQRQRQVSNFLSQLDQQISGEKQKAQAEAEKRQQADKAQRYEKAWSDLSADGIDRPKLKNIFEQTTKLYGFSDAELAEVYDARMVRVLRDAAAYRDLQAKRSEVTKKVADAPRMPSKQTNPAQDRRDKALDNRFKGGRAKLNDLAAFLR